MLEKRLENELISNLTAFLILHCISANNGQSYGYQMKIYIEHLTGKSISEGTLYPLLSKLADDQKYGYLESFKETTDKKRVRRFYKLTQKGLKALESWPSKWFELRDYIEFILVQLGKDNLQTNNEVKR